MTDNLTAIVSWLKDNKDGLGALASLLAPMVAIIAALVIYRAVITGPKTQLAISKQYFQLSERQMEISNRQIDLQRQQALEISNRQIDLQRQQTHANLFGTYEQKWIDNFREKTAEALLLMQICNNSAERMARCILEAPNASHTEFEKYEILVPGFQKSYVLTQNIRLMLDSEDKLHKRFVQSYSVLWDSQFVHHEYDTAGNMITKVSQARVRAAINGREVNEIDKIFGTEKFFDTETLALDVICNSRARMLNSLHEKT